MNTEITAEYSTPNHTLLLKFDVNQEFAREVQLSAFNNETSACTNPFKDIPITKTICLNRLPPWTDPDSLQNLMQRVSGGSTVKLVRVFKIKPLLPLSVDDNSDESIWPRPDRFGHSIRGFKQAHVVFEKTSGVNNVISEASNNPNRVWLLSTSDHPVVNVGLRKWKREYNAAVVPNDAAKQRLQHAIEEYIREYDRIKDEKKEKAKAMIDKQEAGDDDGWITVSRHTSKKGKPVGNLSAKGQAKIKAKDAKRKSKKELLNFYKFQTREKKLDRLNELKTRFEADKLKQAKMKQERMDRKFKPA